MAMSQNPQTSQTSGKCYGRKQTLRYFDSHEYQPGKRLQKIQWQNKNKNGSQLKNLSNQNASKLNDPTTQMDKNQILGKQQTLDDILTLPRLKQSTNIIVNLELQTLQLNGKSNKAANTATQIRHQEYWNFGRRIGKEMNEG